MKFSIGKVQPSHAVFSYCYALFGTVAFSIGKVMYDAAA